MPVVATTAPTPELTEAQAIILGKFATIQAELECLVRETRRTHDSVKKKKGT